MNVLCIDKPVLSFDMDGTHMYAISGKSIFKSTIEGHRIEIQKEFFQKEGLSRGIVCDGNRVYCRDFCDFYVLDASTLQTVFESKLGTDLSSDICGITYDDTHIYASIRNGTLAKIDKETFMISFHTLTQTTFLLQPEGDRLYCVAGGTLYVFNKNDQSLQTFVHVHKVCEGFIMNDIHIMTAGKDKLVLLDKLTLHNIKEIKKPHKFSFQIVGFYGNHSITYATRDGVIRFWDTETLSPCKDFPVPVSLTGEMKISGKYIYYTSRNINGIECFEPDLSSSSSSHHLAK